MFTAPIANGVFEVDQAGPAVTVVAAPRDGLEFSLALGDVSGDRLDDIERAPAASGPFTPSATVVDAHRATSSLPPGFIDGVLRPWIRAGAPDN